MTDKPAEIRCGIEWFNSPDGGEDCQCGRCGSSCDFFRCTNVGCDHGYIEDADGEYDGIICDHCWGTGGSWHCLSTPEYCKAHPMSGREEVNSTALSAEAWRDNS